METHPLVLEPTQGNTLRFCGTGVRYPSSPLGRALLKYLCVLLFSFALTVLTSLGLYAYFFLRNLGALRSSSGGQNLSENIGFCIFDGLLLMIALLELVCCIVLFLRELRFEFVGEYVGTDDAISPLLQFSTVHFILLLAVVVSDIAMLSEDIIADIPLLMLVASNTLNMWLVFSMRRVISSILKNDERTSQDSGNYFVKASAISSVLGLISVLGLYLYFIVRNSLNLSGAGRETVQSRSEDIIFIIVDALLSFVCILQMVIVWRFYLSRRRSIHVRHCSSLRLLLLTSFMHFLLLLAVACTDFAIGSDVTVDIPLLSLVINIGLFGLSTYYLEEVMKHLPRLSSSLQ